MPLPATHSCLFVCPTRGLRTLFSLLQPGRTFTDSRSPRDPSRDPPPCLASPGPACFASPLTRSATSECPDLNWRGQNFLERNDCRLDFAPSPQRGKTHQSSQSVTGGADCRRACHHTAPIRARVCACLTSACLFFFIDHHIHLSKDKNICILIVYPHLQAPCACV